MPNFCPNCAATLDPDAKFCPSCSSPIAYAAPGASQMPYGGGVNPGMQRPAGPAFNMGGAMAGAKVDPLLWASIISVFWFLWFFISGMTSLSIFASLARGVGTTETSVIFTLINNAFQVLAAAFWLVIAYGILNRKRWVYGLFMLSIGPLAFLWLVLSLITFLVPGSSPAGIVIVYILGLLAGLAMIGVLTMIVMKNKHQFTN